LNCKMNFDKIKRNWDVSIWAVGQLLYAILVFSGNLTSNLELIITFVIAGAVIAMLFRLKLGESRGSRLVIIGLTVLMFAVRYSIDGLFSAVIGGI
jgi:hypothetical protein